MGMFDIDRARKLLNEAHVFFGEDEEIPELAQTLNMNDTWAWACSDSQYVKDEELPEVAELFWRYGNCGILYWVSRKNENCRSEFLDYNRMIDFVAHEEQLRKDEPSDSQRGYKKLVYTLGGGWQ